MTALLLAATLFQAGPSLVFDITFLGRGVKIYHGEFDGNPATREWVVNATWPGEQQGFFRNVQSPGANHGLCVGPWYDARPEEFHSLATEAHLETINGRTYIMGIAEGPEEGRRRYFDAQLVPPNTCT